MLIRVPINSDNSVIMPVYGDRDTDEDGSGPGGAGSGSGNDGEDGDGTGSGTVFSLPEPVPFLSVASVPDYTYSRYPNPVTPVNVSVPDDDRPVIASWLGNSSASPVAPSDTLVKRMTQAVTSAMNAYFTAASRLNLFTSPFRLALALRVADGTHMAISTPILISPATMAPLMVIHEPETAGSILKTQTEIINSPTRLSITIPSFTLPQEFAGIATHLDIIATRQTPLLTGSETVSAIRSYSVRGSSQPCWHYSRLAEDLVRAAALADNEFRIIASVPINEAAEGVASLSLPSGDRPISEWEDFPKVSMEAIPDIQDPESPVVTGWRLVTDALDLNRPEEYKRVRGVTLRGVFPRPFGTDGDGVGRLTLTLYGSHHRERWHRIATVRGAHIRLLRRVRYRWYRVEAEAGAPARFDAVVFEVRSEE